MACMQVSSSLHIIVWYKHSLHDHWVTFSQHGVTHAKHLSRHCRSAGSTTGDSPSDSSQVCKALWLALLSFMLAGKSRPAVHRCQQPMVL